MEGINSLISFLQLIIPLAAAARVAYCLLIAGISEEDAKAMRVRARNALIFTVLAEVLLPLLDLFLSYF